MNDPQGYPPNTGYPQNPGYPPQGVGYAPGPVGFAYTQPPPGNAPVTFAPGPTSGYPPPGAGYAPPPGGTAYPPPGQGYAPPQQQPPIGPNGIPLAPFQSGRPGVPPGLEYLTMVDQLLVHQKKELLEVFLGCETKNKYTIKNSLGQQVYRAKEDTDCCTRNCCGRVRPFDIKILDNSDNEVMHLSRGLRCECCCCFCCLQRLEVTAPPGTPIGAVVQEWSLCAPKYRIENESGECVLRIEGPICTCRGCGDVNFKVLSKDGATKVGKVSKQWSGLLTEAFTDADHFGINFPLDLDVRIKAVLLGALFLIDFMHFEQSGEGMSDMLSSLT